MPHRDKLVLEFWDRSKELSVKNKKYRSFASQFLQILLRNDIGSGDATSKSLVNGSKNISASIIAKEDGIFAGLDEFRLMNDDLKINPLRHDGDRIKAGEILVRISGPARKILERERTYLNLLQRMSGIATLTDELSKKLKNVRLAATRKTLWGGMDKRAVSIGKGLTHRIGLSDGILVKDNHLEALGYNFERVVDLAKSKSKYVEIEVENKKHALYAAEAIKSINKKTKGKNLFAIMLDNIRPKEIMPIIKELKKQELYDYVLLEASGNINPSNFMEYDDCGVDVISMGFITNSAKKRVIHFY
ncbi:carboxylating nicotinate-nucleotide diphosphorylase [Candidatus Woesearchaeota archaeon]|nr:carboxylating nicotinate-nucleotide diphosphorylase [Candidatus Woesearchaeota archaeon]